MNLDERIAEWSIRQGREDNPYSRPNQASGYNLTIYVFDEYGLKQLIRNVLEEVKPERAEIQEFAIGHLNRDRVVAGRSAWNGAVDVMEARIKELGL